MIDSQEPTDSEMDIIYNPINCWDYLNKTEKTFDWLSLENGEATVKECMELLEKNWLEERAKLEAYIIWQIEYVRETELYREEIQSFVNNYSFDEFMEGMHKWDSKDEQYAHETPEQRSAREAFMENYYKEFLASGEADAQRDTAFYQAQLEALKQHKTLDSAAESDWSGRVLRELAPLAPYYF